MSKNSIVKQTRNQLTVNTDITKTFVWMNRFETVEFYYDNTTLGDVIIPEGTVLGRILSSQKVVPWTSGATDGSQYPVGILKDDVYVVYGSIFDGNASMCVAGDVAGEKIGLQGSDTLTTQVGTSGRSLQDWLSSVQGGIRIMNADQHTAYDNS
jgi:Bacteriophage lambda head decoration protein D